MLFCPKCGSLMRTRQEGSKKVLACSCGYAKKAEGEMKENVSKSTEIEVADESQTGMDTTEATCPKCHHDKAYFWMHQTRASDEPETKFFKCVKCKHTWREYD